MDIFYCLDESKKAEKCNNQCTGCFRFFQQQIIAKLKDFESLDVYGNSYIKQKHYLKLSQELIEVLYSNAT